MRLSSSCPFRSGIHAWPISEVAAKVLSVELNPAGVERNAAESSCDASDGEVDDVESAHAPTATRTAAAARMRNDVPFMACFLQSDGARACIATAPNGRR